MKRLNLIVLLIILSINSGCTINSIDNSFKKEDNKLIDKEISETKNEDEDNKQIKNENDIIYTTKSFLEALNNNDVESFKRLVSPSGLVVIRNFVSGNGARGKNIRNLYLQEDISKDIEFPVEDEIQLNPQNLFSQSLATSYDKIPIEKVEGTNFNFLDSFKTNNYGPTTNRIWEICDDIISSVKQEELNSPMLFDLSGKEFALVESFDDYNTGNWAVFEKIEDKYYLRAIVEFR